LKIPDKVKIGGIIYNVKLISGKVNNELHERNYIGRIDHERCIITVDSDIDNQRMVNSLLHELVHGIEYQYQIEISEKDIDRFANGLYQVLKDNNLKDLL
jgi:hypothetical protein